MGGGVPSGSSILLLADPSNAPYVFNEQFTVAGLDKGQRVLFYSLERPKDEIVAHLKQLSGKDPGANLVFFDCYSVKMRQLPAPTMKKLGITNHAVNVTEDVVGRLMEQEKGKPYRLVIESLSEAISAYGLEPALTMIRQVTGINQKLGGLAVFLLIKGVHDHGTETLVRHLADGVIEFGVDRQGFGLYSYLSISKMRGVPDATRLLLYKETDKGLWLESTRRVF